VPPRWVVPTLDEAEGRHSPSLAGRRRTAPAAAGARTGRSCVASAGEGAIGCKPEQFCRACYVVGGVGVVGVAEIGRRNLL
jgi:hypothetical protein